MESFSALVGTIRTAVHSNEWIKCLEKESASAEWYHTGARLTRRSINKGGNVWNSYTFPFKCRDLIFIRLTEQALHVKAVYALQLWGDRGEMDTEGDSSGRWEPLVKERWNNERENRVKGGEQMNQGDKSSLWVISQGTRCHWWGWKNTQQSSAMTSPNNCCEPFMVLPETSALENAGKTKKDDAAGGYGLIIWENMRESLDCSGSAFSW